MPACNHVADDLAALVDGDDAVLSRHADHLASCDDCRDARHEATRLARLVAHAGDDHAAPGDLEARVLAAIDAQTVKPAPAPAPAPVAKTDLPPTPMRGRRKSIYIAAVASTALAAGVVGFVATRDRS